VRETAEGGVLNPNGCHGSLGVGDGGADEEAGLDIVTQCSGHKQWSHRLNTKTQQHNHTELHNAYTHTHIHTQHYPKAYHSIHYQQHNNRHCINIILCTLL